MHRQCFNGPNNSYHSFWMSNLILCLDRSVAHKKRRLLGELIVYTCSGVRPFVHNFKHLLLKNRLAQSQPNFYGEPPWVGGMEVCSLHLGHMTNLAAIPIYSKNHSKIFSPQPVDWYSQNFVCSIGDSYPLIVCSNDDPRVDLDLVYSKDKFGN